MTILFYYGALAAFSAVSILASLQIFVGLPGRRATLLNFGELFLGLVHLAQCDIALTQIFPGFDQPPSFLPAPARASAP